MVTHTPLALYHDTCYYPFTLFHLLSMICIAIYAATINTHLIIYVSLISFSFYQRQLFSINLLEHTWIRNAIPIVENNVWKPEFLTRDPQNVKIVVIFRLPGQPFIDPFLHT